MPAPFLAKTLQELTKESIISSIKGPHGGFYLSKENEKKTLFNIIDCLDDVEKFNQCYLGQSECSDEKPCVVHHLYTPFKKKLIHKLKTQTILEVANECVGDEDTTTEDVASSSEDDEGGEGKDDEGVDGSEEEEEDEGIELDEEVSVLSSYGSYEYQKGKDSQKALYCYYERFGFREEPHYNTELGCFSDTPYPSMALDLPSLDLTELSKALVDPTYVVGDYSNYCQEFGNSSVCSS